MLLLKNKSDDSTHSAEAIKRYEEWALDNGFEFIEIGATNITEGNLTLSVFSQNLSISSIYCPSGFADREKFGLPRLMEALESNMWSTMRRRTAPLATPAPAATPAHAPAADATPKPIPQLQPPLPLPPGSDSTASTTSSVPASAEAGGGNEDSVASGAGAGERDPFELDMADSEDNEIIDKYSSFISEVGFN